MNDRDCRECGLDLDADPDGDHDESHRVCWSCWHEQNPEPPFTPRDSAEWWVHEQGITDVAEVAHFMRMDFNAEVEPGGDESSVMDEFRVLAEQVLARQPKVQFVSPDELRASTPAEPPWRWKGYLAEGGVTVLAGKPKCGKSTLAIAIAHAVASSASDFLGHAATGGPVVYVSEEGAATLAHKVGGERLRIATRETAWPRPEWPTLIDAARAEAERVGAVLIVIDTFAFWAMLKADAEKDAGAVQQAMDPLVQLADAGFAVLLVVHARKGNSVEAGEGDAVRGSSAIIGAADIVLELERVKDLPRQRKLLALSRYPQTPGVLVFERGDDDWSVVGEGTDRGDARDIAARGVLLAALSLDEDRTRAELEAAGVDWRDSHDALDGLIASGVVARSGEGKRGDPYRYRKLWESAPQKPTESVGADGLGVGVCIPVGDTPTQTAPRRFRDENGSPQKAREIDASADVQRAERLAERHADLRDDNGRETADEDEA
jgi:hypothetical protein